MSRKGCRQGRRATVTVIGRLAEDCHNTSNAPANGLVAGNTLDCQRASAVSLKQHRSWQLEKGIFNCRAERAIRERETVAASRLEQLEVQALPSITSTEPFRRGQRIVTRYSRAVSGIEAWYWDTRETDVRLCRVVFDAFDRMPNASEVLSTAGEPKLSGFHRKIEQPGWSCPSRWDERKDTNNFRTKVSRQHSHFARENFSDLFNSHQLALAGLRSMFV